MFFSIHSVKEMIWKISSNDIKRDIVKNVLNECEHVKITKEMTRCDINCSICNAHLPQLTLRNKPSFYIEANFGKEGKFSFDMCFWCHNHIYPHPKDDTELEETPQ